MNAGPMKSKFYVSCNWHDYPEGGTYGTEVLAETHEEALQLCHAEMAAITAESIGYEDEPDSCANCGNEDQDGSDVCPDCGGNDWLRGTKADDEALRVYGPEWHPVDCYRLIDTEMGQLLARIIEAWDDGTRFHSETLPGPIQAAKEFFHG